MKLLKECIELGLLLENYLRMHDLCFMSLDFSIALSTCYRIFFWGGVAVTRVTVCLAESGRARWILLTPNSLKYGRETKELPSPAGWN